MLRAKGGHKYELINGQILGQGPLSHILDEANYHWICSNFGRGRFSQIRPNFIHLTRPNPSWTRGGSGWLASSNPF